VSKLTRLKTGIAEFFRHVRIIVWCAVRGGVYTCWQWPLIFGAGHMWYDGPHYVVHFGFFSFEVSAP
jgi:hypothetical protein